jgi:hypothetical protein
MRSAAPVTVGTRISGKASFMGVAGITGRRWRVHQLRPPITQTRRDPVE